jgi:hypothetical protein
MKIVCKECGKEMPHKMQGNFKMYEIKCACGGNGKPSFDSNKE